MLLWPAVTLALNVCLLTFVDNHYDVFLEVKVLTRRKRRTINHPGRSIIPVIIRNLESFDVVKKVIAFEGENSWNKGGISAKIK